MVNGNTKESVMDEVIEELIGLCRIREIEFPQQVEQLLNEWGYMIVPIEDPTNMFGVMEDSL